MVRHPMWLSACEVLNTLAGGWRFDRLIDNGASMSGVAAFIKRDGACLDYHEQGRLRLAGGQILGAERRYIFRDEDNGFSALFAENPPRLFHRIVLRLADTSLTGTGRHFCGDDRYETRYEFRADGSFGVRHAVFGPRKRYAIMTDYVRANLS